MVWGRHPVREALASGRPVHRLLLTTAARNSPQLAELLSLAQALRVPAQVVTREELDRLCRGHQGVAAQVAPFRYASVEAILRAAAERVEPALVLVLAGVQDPQNLGAMLRSADGAAAHGVIVPSHRAAGVTGAVLKASAGAAEHILLAQVSNIARTLEGLKRAGLWVYGLEADGEMPLEEADLRRPLALVVGGEGKGLGRLVRRACDQVLCINYRGHVGSYNVSAAAAIALYAVRQHRQQG